MFSLWTYDAYSFGALAFTSPKKGTNTCYLATSNWWSSVREKRQTYRRDIKTSDFLNQCSFVTEYTQTQSMTSGGGSLWYRESWFERVSFQEVPWLQLSRRNKTSDVVLGPKRWLFQASGCRGITRRLVLKLPTFRCLWDMQKELASRMLNLWFCVNLRSKTSLTGCEEQPRTLHAKWKWRE